MQNEEEELIATLIHSDEYSHHMNQVASVTTSNIIYLKRKFVSKSGHELIKHPIIKCQRINYKDERSIVLMAFGALLVLLICYIIYALFTYWDRLESGTHIYIGLLGLALIYGVKWVVGARSHKLEFVLIDNTRLMWKSRAGEFKSKQTVVNRIIEFAKSKGVLQMMKES
jgi:hypothetical protein